MTRGALAALVTATVLLAAGVSGASAAPQATTKATAGCWLQVINDWLDNNRVDQLYPIPCYTQAIQQLNRYPDVRYYSNAADDIHRALLAAIHDRGNGGPDNTNGGGGGKPSTPGGPGKGGGGSGGGTQNASGGPIQSIIGSGRPHDARSIPLPLIILAALAVLLLLAAAGTWFLRRVQSRRTTPRPTATPAPATRPAPRRGR